MLSAGDSHTAALADTGDDPIISPLDTRPITTNHKCCSRSSVCVGNLQRQQWTHRTGGLYEDREDSSQGVGGKPHRQDCVRIRSPGHARLGWTGE